MGVRTMIAKVMAAIKSGDSKKAKETSRINLDTELEAVCARLEAEALAKIHEEANAAHAAKGG